MNAPAEIFELVDATDDEHYYTLGIFLDEQAALSWLRHPKPPVNEHDNDAVELEVRARKIGFHPHKWRVVAKRAWVREWDDGAPLWK